MRRREMFVAIGLGVLAALLVIVAAAVVLRSSAGGQHSARADAGVVLALVLPDANGRQATRVVVYYPADSHVAKVVDPATSVTVPGTSASTLGDALTFGGGSALAAAYAKSAHVTRPAWVVLSEDGWRGVADGDISVSLPRPLDVFNGTDLVTFPRGYVTLKPGDLGILLGSLGGLSPSERRGVLGDAAAAVQRALLSSPSEPAGLTTDLSPGRLRTWRQALGERSAIETGTP